MFAMYVRLHRLAQHWWPALLCALMFYSLGWPFLRLPGIQNDEVLFSAPLYQPIDEKFGVPIFHHNVPLMLLPYLGTLKTWLYVPVLHFWVSSLAVRIPVLLVGSATIAAFFLLLENIHGRTAAWIGTVLLATDAVFLLTTCFDWGPVAFQHFFLVTGLLVAAQFTVSGSGRSLFWAFLLFGLAFWDKALFIWTFSGVVLATLAVYPRQVWKRLSWKNAGIAVFAILLGGLPLLAYNVSRGFPTLRSNSGFGLDDLPQKIQTLRLTWQGSVLLGYLINREDGGHPRQPETPAERFAFRLHAIFGDRWKSWIEPALLFSVVLLPILWLTRSGQLPLFCLIATTVAWLMMILTKGAGGAAHHTILLWPLPQLFLAASFAGTSRWLGRAGPALVAVVTGLLAAQNLLVLNQNLYQLVRAGSAGSWSDAIYSLSDVVPKIPATRIVIDDWGMVQPLDLLHRGRLPLVWAGDPFLEPETSQEERRDKLALLADLQALWIGHTDGYQEFSGVNSRVLAATAAAGFHKLPVTTISDRNGRPVFELFRFAANSLGATDEHR